MNLVTKVNLMNILYIIKIFQIFFQDKFILKCCCQSISSNAFRQKVQCWNQLEITLKHCMLHVYTDICTAIQSLYLIYMNRAKYFLSVHRSMDDTAACTKFNENCENCILL